MGMKIPKITKIFRSKKSPSRENTSESLSSRSTSSSASDESADFPESQSYLNHSSSPQIEEAPKQVGSNVASCSKLDQYQQGTGYGGVVLDQELVEAFNILDRDKDGKISAEELGAVLKSLGDDMPTEYLQGMVDAVDANHDGHVDFEEFLELNKRACEEVAGSGELRAAFSIFDINKDEYISADELHLVLNKLGQQSLTREDCSRMIKAVDGNGDGKVDFGEFQMMMTGSLLV